MLTFIIPTIGRQSLVATLQCLKNQTNNNWKAIVVFDGMTPNISETDTRIKIIHTPKRLGQGHNSAGLVRNYGIKFADTEWVAFLDDDDGISSNYVELFLFELFFESDVILFRMSLDDRICPSLEETNFYKKNVGISFALKKSIFDKVIFNPSWEEDFEFLEKIREQKYKIILSPRVTYMANSYNKNNESYFGKRGFINY